MPFNTTTTSTTIVLNGDQQPHADQPPRERIIPIKVEKSAGAGNPDRTTSDDSSGIERSFRDDPNKSRSISNPDKSKTTIIKVSSQHDDKDDHDDRPHYDSKRMQPHKSSSSMKQPPEQVKDRNINKSKKKIEKPKDTSSSSSSSSSESSSDSDVEDNRKHNKSSKSITTTTTTTKNVAKFPFTKEIPRRHSIEIQTTIDTDQPSKHSRKDSTPHHHHHHSHNLKKSSKSGGDINNNPERIITTQPGKSILKSHPVASSTPIPSSYDDEQYSVGTIKSNVIRKKPSKCSKCKAWWCAPFKLCCNCAPFECECCDCCYWKCYRCQQCICQCCNQKCC